MYVNEWYVWTLEKLSDNWVDSWQTQTVICENELWIINMKLEKNSKHELTNEISDLKVPKISPNSNFWQVINAILCIDWLVMYVRANTYNYTYVDVNCMSVCGWWIGRAFGGG